jgi:hypothetical protein
MRFLFHVTNLENLPPPSTSLPCEWIFMNIKMISNPQPRLTFFPHFHQPSLSFVSPRWIKIESYTSKLIKAIMCVHIRQHLSRGNHSTISWYFFILWEKNFAFESLLFCVHLRGNPQLSLYIQYTIETIQQTLAHSFLVLKITHEMFYCLQRQEQIEIDVQPRWCWWDSVSKARTCMTASSASLGSVKHKRGT